MSVHCILLDIYHIVGLSRYRGGGVEFDIPGGHNAPWSDRYDTKYFSFHPMIITQIVVVFRLDRGGDVLHCMNRGTDQ